MRNTSSIILAMDTSTRTVGVALYNGVEVLAEHTWSSRDYHTVELAPAVAEVFTRNAIKAAELGAIAIAIGPGSFTGLRIGLALAKGMALALHIVLVGVPTLDILASAQPIREEQMAAVLRAGRGRLVVGWYHLAQSAWQPGGKIEVLTVEELDHRVQSPTYICGELTAEENKFLARRHKTIHLASPAQSLRRPAFLAEIGWKRWQAGQGNDPTTMAPFYLHYNDPVPG
jgi:tRNA threonylcarbamoyladenosine biosynthesis protein TsaB